MCGGVGYGAEFDMGRDSGGGGSPDGEIVHVHAKGCVGSGTDGRNRTAGTGEETARQAGQGEQAGGRYKRVVCGQPCVGGGDRTQRGRPPHSCNPHGRQQIVCAGRGKDNEVVSNGKRDALYD